MTEKETADAIEALLSMVQKQSAVLMNVLELTRALDERLTALEVRHGQYNQGDGGNVIPFHKPEKPGGAK